MLTGSDGKVDLLILIFVLAGSGVSRFAIGRRLRRLRGIAILDFIYLWWRRQGLRPIGGHIWFKFVRIRGRIGYEFSSGRSWAG